MKSSTYSHSWHWNQSVSVHWSASCWLMRSSSLHPQQLTNTPSLWVLMICSIWWLKLAIGPLSASLLLMFLSLITGNSIAQFPRKSTLNFTFFSFYLSANETQSQRAGAPPRAAHVKAYHASMIRKKHLSLGS